MGTKDYRSACGLSLVWPGLWVGSAHTVTSQFLQSHGVSILIWATPEVSPPSLPDSVNMIRVPVKDDTSAEIGSFFPTMAVAFRESQGCGMVVVCRAGVSRSASLALAALVGQRDTMPEMTLKCAYETLKGARPFIRPNNGFFSQLISYEMEVRGVSSVMMVTSPYDASEKIPDVYLEELKQTMGPTFNTFVPL